MKKVVILLSAIVLMVGIFAGCNSSSNKPAATTAPTTKAGQATEMPTPDVTTTASTATDEATLTALTSATSPSWIVILKGDLAVKGNVVLDGDLKSPQGQGRTLAFYNQDANKTLTDVYTLTAPNLVIKSPNATLKGNLKGDLYIEAAGFKLNTASIEGNVYFKDAAIKAEYDANKAATAGTETESTVSGDDTQIKMLA